MSIKKTILLTNDDGFHAAGIKALYDVFSKEHNVVVVAPEKEQSGVGHTFTFNRPLHYREALADEQMPGYLVTGSPADCVKFAVSFLLPVRPDVIVSGMNHGDNSGLSAFYSGTVAAAREGAFWSIPSFAFSVCMKGMPFAREYADLALTIMKNILDAPHKPVDPKVYYNVNFPPCDPKEMKGCRLTWQSMAFFDDRYEKVEVESHHTKEGYLVYGEKKDIEKSNSYDSRALMNNFTTITPLTFDSTALGEFPYLQWIEDSSKS
ncbi:MAG: 5'/3'-nucleotidase SurE [Chitinispirillales bacterium]|jgi:5'-nucleotidase|nr:5'/3'-nucleotidase SurE [Chitinispirillales bacterium]